MCILPLSLVNSSVLARQINNQTCDIVKGSPLDAGNYGPFDYTNPAHQKHRPQVESHHFTREVEALISGRGSSTPGGDLQYTLRKFPNHHRALYAMIRYKTESHKWSKHAKSIDIYSMECFFRRANYFRPKDPIIYMLHGMYFHKLDDLSAAESQYLKSLEIQEQIPETHYNLGLLYIDMNKLEAAAKHAKLAYASGYPLAGLRNKLTKLNINLN